MSGPLTTRRRVLERSYQRHVADVFHYTLGVLTDPLDAEEVTQATFLNAQRTMLRDAPRLRLNALLGIAHEVCRQRGGHPRISDADLPAAEERTPIPLTCSAAELAISRHLDDGLSRGRRRLLGAHLHACGDCESFARAQLAQRAALRSLAAIPLPETLQSFARHLWHEQVKTRRKLRPHAASP
jgi:hypothetical protein